jgi:galactose-1-phosphate uridylyltransferase
MTIEFRRDMLTARFMDPVSGQADERRLDVRFDPLLGTSSRIVEGVRLPSADVGAPFPFPSEDPECPFCPGRIALVTPRTVPAVASEGRLRCGEALLFPNLVPYSQYAAVAIFSSRHRLSLGDFSSSLVRDNVAVSLDYIRRVTRADTGVRYCAYNVNYLYPSGGSLLHPHSQIYLDPHPTTMMRLRQDAANHYLAQFGRSFSEDLVVEEERLGERYVGTIGGVVWMTPFAPIGFNEVRAVVRDRKTLLDLTADDLTSLATGIARVLAWYHQEGYNSFNLVLHSSVLDEGPALGIHLSMITRAALSPYYRSDAMYLERLHWEAAVDQTPEDVASKLRPSFQKS